MPAAKKPAAKPAPKPPPPAPKAPAAQPPPAPKAAAPKPAPKASAAPTPAARPAAKAEPKAAAKPAAKAAAQPKAKAAAPAKPKAASKPVPKAKAATPKTPAKPKATPKAKAKATAEPKAKDKVKVGDKKVKGKVKQGTHKHGPKAGADTSADAITADSDEATNIKTVLHVGYGLDAPDLALMAMLCLGFGENSWQTLGCNSSDHCGVFQLSSGLQAEHPYTDVAYWAKRAYQDGFYSYGGIIPIARAHPDYSPGRITNMCQGAYSDLTDGANYYDQYEQDAADALKQYGKASKGGTDWSSTGQGSGGAPDTSTEVSLRGQIHKLDWAGGVENVIKAIMGGSNQAAHMAQTFSDGLQKLSYVQPTAKGKT